MLTNGSRPLAILNTACYRLLKGFSRRDSFILMTNAQPHCHQFRSFIQGFSSIQPLIRSDWECMASASFFGSFADERTGAENSTLGFSIGFGFFHKIVGDSALSVAPYALAFYDMSWWTLGEETSRGGAFSGQIGLEVDLSPTMSVMGSIIYPLKADRGTLYGIFLSFHPSVTRSDIVR